MNAKRKTVLALINAERMRQLELLQAGKIKFDCADPEVHHDRKIRVIVEEVGEVAQAVDALENLAGSGQSKSTAHFFELLGERREHLRKELVQVAAVATAWAESLLPRKGESR